MANTQLTTPFSETVVVTEGPPADGSWCQSVSMSAKKATRLICSRRAGGLGEVSIQFQTGEAGAAWQDYVGDLEIVDGNRLLIEDHASGVKWHIGVKQNNYISGTIRVGIGW